MLKRMIQNNHNRRRLIRFNLIRQQLCPLCGYIVCFDNKQNTYVCRNADCNFKEEKVEECNANKNLITAEIKNSLP